MPANEQKQRTLINVSAINHRKDGNIPDILVCFASRLYVFTIDHVFGHVPFVSQLRASISQAIYF